MDSAEEQMGRMVLERLIRLRKEKASLSFQDIGAIFMGMAPEAQLSASPQFQQEISRLAHYITDAKQEIFALSPHEKPEDALTDASLHLDEVIKATEKATNIIMDATDLIQHASAGIGGETEKQIMDATHRIYDSCNFQDITGQRINRVMKLLANIEDRIGKLNDMFGTYCPISSSKLMPLSPINDRDLLNGPQLSEKAPSQAEIDMLFASLGGKN
jgi:chemotaxis protein CheZ